MSAAAIDPVAVPTWRATAVLPYEDARSAASGLRAELRHQLGTGRQPNWSTFTVSAPVRSPDAAGRMWFQYTATVSAAEPLPG